MAELGELAAVLAAAGNNTSQAKAMQSMFNSQPNSMETGLALEATRNPIAALYYQAARNERMQGSAVSPQQLEAIKAAQQRDYELERLKATAGPLATVAGHSQAAIPGVLNTLGAPLNEELFALEQILNAQSTQASTANDLGSTVQSASAGGGDFNDILSQLGFDTLNRTTPTSVQSAAAGRSEPKPTGPEISDVGYFDAKTRTVKYPPGYIPSQEEADTNIGRPSINIGDGTDDQAPMAPPPEVIARHNRSTASWGFTPQGDIQFNGYDDRDEPVFIQRVVRGGQSDVLVSTRNNSGEWVTTMQSRLGGGQQ